MTWSYDPTLPTDKDKIRFYAEDTDPDDQLKSDEEIATLRTDIGANLFRVAAVLARSIALKVGRRPTITRLTAGIDADQQYQHWMQLAKELDAKAGTIGATGSSSGIYAGGISKSDMETREEDEDRPAPAFTVGLHQS